MIIECPECGAKNSIDKPLESGWRYRCGKCETLLVFTQTGIFTKVPPDKARLKVNKGTNRNRGWLGCLGLIAVVIIIVLVIRLSSSDDNTQQTPPTQTPAETQTITENPRYIYEDGAIHVGADGKPIELINNLNSTNPTYAELVAFVRVDDTDTKLYLEKQIGGLQPFVCADFAEAVHNNAEAKGIRAAWVCIDLKGEEIGHALNAFETTDKGLVYVDCTGVGLGGRLRLTLEASSMSQDCIAYVEIGKEYGCVGIDKAKSPSYSFYDKYKQKWYECDRLLSEYNEEVTQYNREIEGGIYYEGSSEATRIEAWEARLEEKKRVIVKLAEELDDFLFEPLGIVEDVFIRW